MLRPLTYSRPKSLDAALALLAEKGDRARALAGGTDLLVDVRAGLADLDAVVDLKGVRPLHALDYDARGGLAIGACVTINELLEHPAVARHYRLLHAAASELATHALRNRATVAGNIVTASPCGDMSGPLLCYGADVLITSTRGSRTVPFRQFISGVKKTVLEPDEIVERIVVLPSMRDARGGYKKLKRIKGHDLGVVSVAMLKHKSVMRFAIGSAAPTPILLDDFPPAASPQEVCEEAARRISPIDDVRCTKEYRAFMVGVFIRRLMEEVR
jgi:carbon-monoxide dehydrogenase medium subunit